VQLNLALVGLLNVSLALEDPFDNQGLDGIYVDEALFEAEQVCIFILLLCLLWRSYHSFHAYQMSDSLETSGLCTYTIAQVPACTRLMLACMYMYVHVCNVYIRTHGWTGISAAGNCHG